MIKLKKVSYSYNNKLVIQNVSVEIEKSKIHGILGESGSGKTTLLKIMAGLLEPENGEVLLENKPILKPSEKLIAGNQKIKMVTQSNSLFPNISIFENVAYELRFFDTKYKTARVNKLLKMAGLFALKDRLPREISGGELQRTLIIKAIADEPKVLLLDEPFSNLDSNNKTKLKASLLDIISQEEIACVLVSHDMSDAFGMVDELSIIKKGKLLQSGKPKDVYLSPKSTYIASITGFCNVIQNKIAGEVFDLKLDNSHSNVVIRPEDISIDEKGIYFSEISKNIFLGSYYQIELNYQNVKLIANSLVPIDVSKPVRFNIKSWILVS
jgi:ABC-type Fe3+/spermidine/putrescine transport system ATPase subunit